MTLQARMAEGTRGMQAVAQAVATRLGLTTGGGKKAGGEGRVKLEYRCVVWMDGAGHSVLFIPRCVFRLA